MDRTFLEDLVAPFADVTVKRMFGGTGIFHRGLNFAAVMDDVLRLKADAQTIPDFEAENCGPWDYERKDGSVVTMNYYQVPERLFDDPEEFAEWARKAFDVAMRADSEKPPSKRKLEDGL